MVVVLAVLVAASVVVVAVRRLVLAVAFLALGHGLRRQHEQDGDQEGKDEASGKEATHGVPQGHRCSTKGGCLVGSRQGQSSRPFPGQGRLANVFTTAPVRLAWPCGCTTCAPAARR